MGGSVLSAETFKWSDVVAAEVLTRLVCPRHGSLLPSTVFNALVSVITRTTSAGLLCLSVGAHEHCLGLRATSRHM